jgi:putative transposase
MNNKSENKAVLYAYCQDLAKEFDFVRKLDPGAKQASAERAWASISWFHTDYRNNAVKKGYPQFKKSCRSVEYKLSGWKLSPDGMFITFTDGFNARTFALYCNGEARYHILSFKINRVRVIRRADGYYAQFCLDVEPKEQGAYTGNVICIDQENRVSSPAL